jgi:hypothetical protein
MIKNFLMKKMLQSKLKDVPKDQQDKILMAIEKNPELFQKIALEIQQEVKGGKDQMAAAISVMEKYKGELQQLM